MNIFIWMDLIVYVITNLIFILYYSDLDYFLQPFRVHILWHESTYIQIYTCVCVCVCVFMGLPRLLKW